MDEGLGSCALCPRLCRPACPVATATGREAAVPTWLALAAVDVERGLLDEADARRWLDLCTDCRACEQHCHIHQPLPRLLRQARIRLSPAAPPSLPQVAHEARWVVIESDERPLAKAIAQRLGEPVDAWVCVGVDWGAGRDGPDWADFLASVNEQVAGRSVVTADGGAFRTLQECGVDVRSASDWVASDEAVRSCCLEGAPAPTACCGGAGPLAGSHPEDAGRLAMRWLERGGVTVVVDARCRSHLARSGEVTDVVDLLLEELGWSAQTLS